MAATDLLPALKDLLGDVVARGGRGCASQAADKAGAATDRCRGRGAPARYTAKQGPTMARTGELPVVRLGHHVRFRVSDLEKFVEQKGKTPGSGQEREPGAWGGL